MIPFNYHTHTVYCDGKSTPMEVAEAAYRKGLRYLGFSGHAFVAEDEAYSMAAGAEAYRRAVQEAKEAYKGRLEIFCGIEQDLYSEGDGADFDYAIGSVHYIRKNGGFFAVDNTAEQLRRGVRELFGGDPYAMLEEYFRSVALLPEKTAAKIVGHLDLPTKFLGQDPLFDPEDPRFLSAARGAIDRLVQADMIFEINTGAISRGYRKEPYPSPALLRCIREMGGKITLSSDSHQADTVDFGLEKAAKLAKDCGFRQVWYFDGREFLPWKLEDFFSPALDGAAGKE